MQIHNNSKFEFMIILCNQNVGRTSGDILHFSTIYFRSCVWWWAVLDKIIKITTWTWHGTHIIRKWCCLKAPISRERGIGKSVTSPSQHYIHIIIFFLHIWLILQLQCQIMHSTTLLVIRLGTIFSHGGIAIEGFTQAFGLWTIIVIGLRSVSSFISWCTWYARMLWNLYVSTFLNWYFYFMSKAISWLSTVLTVSQVPTESDTVSVLTTQQCSQNTKLSTCTKIHNTSSYHQRTHHPHIIITKIHQH